MRERSAMLASVMFAFVLIAGLMLQSTLSADAEDCIAKPNAPAPQGEHWYYRIDHANNRQCWRLGPEGLRVQKSAPQIEKEIAPAAAVQPPEPARARRPETTGSSVAAAARAEAAPEPNPASAVSSLPFLDTPRMPDLPPSVQPAPQPEPVKRTQTASALDTVPAEDNSASSNVSDAPAASSVAEPPRQAAARPSAPPAPATDMEIDHTFAFLMIVFAVLAVAGPMLHYAERRRRREEKRQLSVSAMGGRGYPEYAHSTRSCAFSAKSRGRQTPAADSTHAGRPDRTAGAGVAATCGPAAYATAARARRCCNASGRTHRRRNDERASSDSAAKLTAALARSAPLRRWRRPFGFFLAGLLAGNGEEHFLLSFDPLL